MSRHRWGAEGPPLEAYSRVTNAERFAPLHVVAAELLDELELKFDVERAQGYGLDSELEEGWKPARPPVTLVPRDVRAGPLVVGFSVFPGLRIRFGRWCMMAFPACGCDACDETAESESEQLKALFENLTAGRFREAIRIPAHGGASKEWESWSAAGRYAQVSELDRDRARQLVAGGGGSSYYWMPWPRRK